MKDPWDVALYPMLLWELRPRTIIEFGSAFGGSAIWMTEIARAFGLDTRTVSYDINRVDLVADQHPGVTFLLTDCTQPATSIDLDYLAGLPHPMLVVEDAHELDPLLDYVHPILQSGDYLVVEDTFDQGIYEGFRQFMGRHRTDYLVDTRYTDWFGYNATWNWNGFLLRR